MHMVAAPLERWGEGKGSWHFLAIQPDESMPIRLEAASLGISRGFGSIRIEASIGEVRWRTSLFPLKAGGYLLPVKAAVRRDAGITEGDCVSVELTLV